MDDKNIIAAFPDKAAALFRDAAKLIERGLILLDTRVDTCSGCGGEHYMNAREGVTYLRLTDMPTKLNEQADMLEGKTEAPKVKRAHARKFRSQP